MDIDDILKNLTIDKGNPNGVYLREIALLMVEIDSLRGTLMVKEKLLKNYENEIKGKIGSFKFDNEKVSQKLSIYKTGDKKFIKY